MLHLLKNINIKGKTSTISMLIGLYETTKGSAKIFGHDLNTDIDGIRSLLGFCP